MTIPTHRADLVRQAEERFDQLEDAIDDLVAAAPASPATPSDQVTDAAASGRRDRDAVDVLNHLHAWHMLLLGWLDADAAGRAPAYPAEGYTWRDLDRLNRDLRDRYRGDGRPWLGGATLAEPVHECLGGHYAWALGALPGLPAGA